MRDNTRNTKYDSSSLVTTMADGLTDELDKNKPNSFSAVREFGSYWDKWLAKQRERGESCEDLFKKYLLGQGDRPDIGAGIIEISFTGGDITAGGSASTSGHATTISNLGEIVKTKTKPIG